MPATQMPQPGTRSASPWTGLEFRRRAAQVDKAEAAALERQLLERVEALQAQLEAAHSALAAAEALATSKHDDSCKTEARLRADVQQLKAQAEAERTAVRPPTGDDAACMSDRRRRSIDFASFWAVGVLCLKDGPRVG